MRKSLLVFALVGVAQLSLASYELALVADFWGKKIDRYDPVSGAYLGSFGGNFLVNPSDVSVDQTNGLAYVADQGDSRMSVFNYSTGELVRTYVTAGSYFVTNLSNGDHLVGSYGPNDTRRYNAAGTLLQTIVTNGIYVEGHAQTADGSVWYLNGGGTKSLHRGTVGSATISGSLWNLVGTASLPAFLSSQGSQLAAMDYNSGTSHRLFSWQTSGASVTSESSILFATSTAEQGAGTSIGHGGAVYGMTTTGVISTMHRWLPGSSFTSRFTLSQTQYAQGMALVVAPEPGGFLALGLGAAVLLRRRK